MAVNTTELLYLFKGDVTQLKSALAQARSEFAQGANFQLTSLRQVAATHTQTEAAKLRAFQQSINQISREEQKRVAESVRSANQRLREEQRTAREVARITAETARQAVHQERIRERSAKQLADVQIREAKRAARELEQSLRQQQIIVAPRGGSTLLAGAFGGATAIIGLSAANEIRQAASAWLEYSSKLENTRIAFTTMLGSAQLAEQHLKDLQQFALATPFQFTDLIEASQRMQALGFSAQQVIPVLKDVGNAVAAAGGGSERLDRVVLALSQMQSKGKVATQEMNQLAEAGIPGWRILEQQLGKSRAELVKMVEAGKVSSKVFLDAFQKFSQQNFGGLMEKQAKTFTGAMSNIKDALLQTSGTAFEPFFKKISEIADRISQEIQQSKPTLDQALTLLIHGLAETLGSLAAEAGAAFSQNFIKNAFDPSKWKLAIQNIFTTSGAGIITSGLRGLFSIDPEDFFGIGDVEIPSIQIPNLTDPLKKLKEQQVEVSESSKKTTELIENLALKLAFYGQNTEKAATQQKLLEQGMEALTSAEGRRAIQLAELIDKQRISAELSQQQERLIKDLASITESKYKAAFQGLTQTLQNTTIAIAELNAEEQGGLTPLQRFNLELGSQIDGLIAAGKASQFTKEQILLLAQGLFSARAALKDLEAAQAAHKLHEEFKAATESLAQFLQRQGETLRQLRFGDKTALQEAEEFIAKFPKLTGAMKETATFSDSFWLRFNAHIIDSTRRMKEMLDLMRETADLVPPPSEGRKVSEQQFVPIDDFGSPPPPRAANPFENFGLDVEGLKGLGPLIADAFIHPIEAVKRAFAELQEAMRGFAAEVATTITPLGDILKDTFFQVADAIGQTIANWVLLGETGPAVMRKILALALASIAAEAAVNAIKELALGFATLFFNPAESASHFTAAALWGSIAGVAAVAGRGVAGDLFKPKSANERGTGGSPEGPRDLNPITLGRNQPQLIRVENVIRVQSNDSHIVRVVANDYRQGGDVRQVIIEDGGPNG